jgi:hypothetical protein
MVELNSIFSELIKLYNLMPESLQVFLDILIPTVFIAIYAILVWKFYRFLAVRDILGLNLKQYAQEGKRKKFFLSLFYFIEYIVIAPLLVMLWLIVFSIFVLLLSQIETTARVLLVSAATVGAIRMTAYYNPDLSKDLAKLLPFTMLAIFLVNPEFFQVTNILSKFGEIPTLLNHIAIYYLFILILEIILRFLFMIFQITASKEELEEISDEEEVKPKKKKKAKR